VPVAIGGLNNRINIRFDLTAIVGAADNQAALANIENLMLAVFDSLPAGASVDQWTQPNVITIGSNEMLTSQITIELVTTNNGN
jgi:glycosylphosphatidylinositol transamidase (GPIT) subunit GPI8